MQFSDIHGLAGKNRKALQKKYIDIAYMPEISMSKQESQMTLKEKSKSNILKKLFHSEQNDRKRKFDEQNNYKEIIKLPLVDSPKCTFLSVKPKMFFNDKIGESKSTTEIYGINKGKDILEGNIEKSDRVKISSEPIIRRGMQGYKYSVLNTNRQVIKNMHKKNYF
ncbi:hypothetical protein SteCoe_29782 [Stentor coeruleus]|uniref:Uncharacterized protein n=1 Tax=Stentor coeruleus TaxID=5963 RepID=A0A1R2B571_9CILI|nr:hypothetical protein SteCoe_29782 [Stentor coeruleus]